MQLAIGTCSLATEQPVKKEPTCHGLSVPDPPGGLRALLVALCQNSQRPRHIASCILQPRPVSIQVRAGRADGAVAQRLKGVARVIGAAGPAGWQRCMQVHAHGLLSCHGIRERCCLLKLVPERALVHTCTGRPCQPQAVFAFGSCACRQPKGYGVQVYASFGVHGSCMGCCAHHCCRA